MKVKVNEYRVLGENEKEEEDELLIIEKEDSKVFRIKKKKIEIIGLVVCIGVAFGIVSRLVKNIIDIK